MCAIYRMVREGWPVEEAVRELPAFGFHEVWVGCLEYLHGLDTESVMDQVAKAEPTKVDIVE